MLLWEKKENKIKNLFGLLGRIRKNRYDCVINCHRYFSSGLLAGFSGSHHIAGYKENPLSFLFNYTARHRIGDGRHETHRYNELIGDFSDSEVFKPRLYPAVSDKEKVAQYQGSGPYVCMAPASVWNTKQLPLEKWVELCNKTIQSTIIYLLGAPGDVELCTQIKSKSSHPKITILAGKLSLLQSCALMGKATMNYVNDSAPLHLASSVNAPVRAFFCSTVPEFGFSPLSDDSKVYGVTHLKCRPCGLHGYRACPLGHFKCGHDMPLPDQSAV